MNIPLLRFTRTGDSGVLVDLDRLVASRALIQANSGGGKSRALRYLLEQTHGRVQHLVIDPEGEFSTLREKFPYVLAGRDGDIPADPKTAKLLCRRLMEIGASAVIDLYELKLEERRAFTRLFLEELMHLPRTLWHPTLVIVDEAHVFAPERGSGESQATEAVIALATQGRKRGYALVAATQRLSKLHKDVAAELLNKLIGRTGLDVDLKRAGDELGMDKEARATLRTMAPGTFYAYGPAIANEVTLVRTGDVQTTHPEAGTLAAPPPPAPAAVAGLLAQLKDIPQAAEEELRALDDFRRKNAALERELRQVKASGNERIVEKVVEQKVEVVRPDFALVAQVVRDHERARSEHLVKISTMLRNMLQEVTAQLQFQPESPLWEAKVVESQRSQSSGSASGHLISPTQRPQRTLAERDAGRPPRDSGDKLRAAPDAVDFKLGKGERVVLTAAAQYPEGVTREQLTILTGYTRSSRNTFLQRLAAAGLVANTKNGGIGATDAGFAALGDDFEPLPTGRELGAYWLERLSGGEREILRVLMDAYPSALTREHLSEMTGYTRSSRNTFLQRLGARQLTAGNGGSVSASPLLFSH